MFAKSCVMSLRDTTCRLAQAGATIVFSIHQPRYSIFKLCDTIMLLGNGRTIYHGPAMQGIEFFQECGNSLIGLSDYKTEWMVCDFGECVRLYSAMICLLLLILEYEELTDEKVRANILRCECSQTNSHNLIVCWLNTEYYNHSADWLNLNELSFQSVDEDSNVLLSIDQLVQWITEVFQWIHKTTDQTDWATILP